MENQKELAAQAADALATGVWLLAADGRALYRNAAAERIAPAIGALADLAGLLPGVPLNAYAEQARSRGGAVEEPAVLLRQGPASALVQLRLVPGPASVPGSLLLTIEEVTARLRVERLRALAETTVAVCHEIANPLAIVSGELELLRRDANVPATRLGALETAVARIAEVLRRLKRATEPLGADYLPSRGVRMLDLRAENKRAPARTGQDEARSASGTEAA
jgi:nitrogen-specific signal transduction histidine kinase